MPFVSKFRFEPSDDERSAQLDEGVRVSEELVRLASRDRHDLRDTPRTILARMNWDIYTWTRDNREPDREALAMLEAYFPQHLFNTLLALLMAENSGLGTLVASLIDTFKRDALDRAKGARLSPASRSQIREATIAFGNGLDSVWETLATPEAQTLAGIDASKVARDDPAPGPRDADLLPTERDTLLQLRENGNQPVPLQDLAHALGKHPSQMTPVREELERRHLAKFRRGAGLVLTQSGREWLDRDCQRDTTGTSGRQKARRKSG